MKFAECPECETRIKLTDKSFIGQHITCFDCGAKLEVYELSPPELGFVYKDELETVGEDDYSEYDDD